MTDAIATPSKPGWPDRLYSRLIAQKAAVLPYQRYYEGHHELSFATAKFVETFGSLFKALSFNLCELIVDSEAERLDVDGFRFHRTGEDDDKDLASRAWDLWLSNGMDTRFGEALTESLVSSVAFAVVEGEGDTAQLNVLYADEAYVHHRPGSHRDRAEAIRSWYDEDERRIYAVVYGPERIEWWRSKASTDELAFTEAQRRLGVGAQWEHIEASSGPNRLGVVPVIPIVNRPRKASTPPTRMAPYVPRGRSELRSMIPLQDVINKLVADLVIASEFVAYPTKWITGMDAPTEAMGENADGSDSAPIEAILAGPGRALVLELNEKGENPQIGQLPQASMQPYVASIELVVQIMASISKIPAHYLLGKSGQFPSGEAITATETGLAKKCRQAQRVFRGPTNEAITLLLRAAGTTVPDGVQVRANWIDAETRSESEHIDAVIKRQSLGYPTEELWRMAGATETDIQRWRGLIEDQERQRAAMSLLGAGEDGAAIREMPVDREQAEVAGMLVRAGFTPESATKGAGITVPLEHTGLLPVTLQSEPEQAAVVEEALHAA